MSHCCNLHCGVFCKLVYYIHSQLSMRLISMEWLIVILITMLMRASTQTLAGCFRAAHHCPSFYGCQGKRIKLQRRRM